MFSDSRVEVVAFGRIKEFLLLVEGFFQGEVGIDDLPDGRVVTCSDVVAEIGSFFSLVFVPVFKSVKVLK